MRRSFLAVKGIDEAVQYVLNDLNVLN